MKTREHIRILIAGGGTGGHVFPAIAIADAFRELHPDTEFLFIGAQGKLEMERVPKAGYRVEGLNIAGFHRPLTLRNAWRNLSFPYKLITSMWKAKRLVRRFAPHAVVGTGGYVSGPVVRSAQGLNIPTLIQEQNSHAGVTNKLLGEKALAICVAYEGMDAYFPKDKIVFTGNPVRQDLMQIERLREEGLRHFGLDSQKKTLVVLGGSLGARTLNQAMMSGAHLLAERSELQVIWQCGRFYAHACLNSDTAGLPNVQVHPFIDRMDLLYAVSDVIISRAGALTISELCLVARPVILVPSPNVAEDHQTKNALALVEKGAARLVRDADAEAQLIPEVINILHNDALAFSLSESIRQLARPGAAHQIARELEKIAYLQSPPRPEKKKKQDKKRISKKQLRDEWPEIILKTRSKP
ncbi:MAG: undecaprenyldiphospho-muramoylpentapeptide beta-N-acetylglucosaminyltransferase [Saprospiraceae bacterium]|nr:undecaprenyldiphospho-muramoylpentapeptide beta-N-acetylglucosaminyltransferase [Saprospiraceae bacterium]